MSFSLCVWFRWNTQWSKWTCSAEHITLTHKHKHKPKSLFMHGQWNELWPTKQMKNSNTEKYSNRKLKEIASKENYSNEKEKKRIEKLVCLCFDHFLLAAVSNRNNYLICSWYWIYVFCGNNTHKGWSWKQRNNGMHSILFVHPNCIRSWNRWFSSLRVFQINFFLLFRPPFISLTPFARLFVHSLVRWFISVIFSVEMAFYCEIGFVDGHMVWTLSTKFVWLSKWYMHGTHVALYASTKQLKVIPVALVYCVQKYTGTFSQMCALFPLSVRVCVYGVMCVKA